MKEFVLKISNRRIVNLQEFKSLLNELKDGKHHIAIKDMRKRSLPQNAYYWGVIVPMVRKGLYESGYDEVQSNDDAHEVIKHIHLKKRIVSKQTGDIIDIAGSTAKLSIPEFNNFIEDVCKWSAEFLSVVIPSPNQELVMFDQHIEKTISDVHTN